ncbi:Unknown protein sequence [Pseudomonas syringae pv. maculicola]|nr:Unknown protein sequence [Pseudomonas syringae pv. maculicola]
MPKYFSRAHKNPLSGGLWWCRLMKIQQVEAKRAGRCLY